MESACRVYRPRDPRKTALWGLLDSLYERVKGSWEERFERSYGFWRGLADEAVARYLDCGVWDNGFARVRCRKCPQEFLVASCKGRGLCPSCGAKRAAELAAFLVDEVAEDVGHAQWVFTIPKMLRVYFLHHRELMGELSRAAAETAKELLAAAAMEEKGFRPGVVSVVQTLGDRANFHPHVHALVTRGGWTASWYRSRIPGGTWSATTMPTRTAHGASAERHKLSSRGTARARSRGLSRHRPSGPPCGAAGPI